MNPIADTLGHREIFLGYTVSGAQHLDSRYTHFGSITVGVLDRFEIGAGHDLLGNGSWSVKASLIEDAELGFGQAALSIGLMNASGHRVDPYLVGRLDLKAARVHLGVARLDGTATLLAGADLSLDRLGILQADFSGGPDGTLWFAHTYTFGNGFSTQFAVGKPNRGQNDWQHFGYIGYGFRF